MARKRIQYFGDFWAGFGSVFNLMPLPYKKYPFTFPEKAMTSDWITLGKDLNKVIEKENKGG